MRDLIVTENITLDGVIDGTGDWFNLADDPTADQADLVAALREQSEASDAFLLGRVTFEDMRAYWPHVKDDPSGIGDYLNKVSKYVVSRTMRDPRWKPSTVLAGLDEIRALKSQTGKDIVTTGSITLVRALIAAGLVDEYRLFVYPVVLGHGEKLFTGAADVPPLHLVETRPFRSGVVLLRYRPTPA
ncbi:dihydrofolate reductase family protein [Nonomuraea sp. SYSU D8015]|uniref:dihydrofolate reductase family protein n=1 Tax=Nonomuraea sp. SYSU D8015 TaxID=2593644 RepID=UPI0016608ED6|nr:dihydrofolate reductase family protein [Nonomuraea sp. SYSU D8015]